MRHNNFTINDVHLLERVPDLTVTPMLFVNTNEDRWGEWDDEVRDKKDETPSIILPKFISADSIELPRSDQPIYDTESKSRDEHLPAPRPFAVFDTATKPSSNDVTEIFLPKGEIKIQDLSLAENVDTLVDSVCKNISASINAPDGDVHANSGAYVDVSDSSPARERSPTALEHVTRGDIVITHRFLLQLAQPTNWVDTMFKRVIPGSPSDWFEEIDLILMQMILKNQHWLRLAINLGSWCVDILDTNYQLNDDRQVDEFMAPIVVQIPYLINKFCQPRLSQVHRLAPFSWSRMKGIYFNERSGDCGPISMKLIKIYATGGNAEKMALITDEIVNEFRDIVRRIGISGFCNQGPFIAAGPECLAALVGPSVQALNMLGEAAVHNLHSYFAFGHDSDTRHGSNKTATIPGIKLEVSRFSAPCGEEVVMKSSATPRNPGCLFYACPLGSPVILNSDPVKTTAAEYGINLMDKTFVTSDLLGIVIEVGILSHSGDPDVGFEEMVVPFKLMDIYKEILDCEATGRKALEFDTCSRRFGHPKIVVALAWWRVVRESELVGGRKNKVKIVSYGAVSFVYPEPSIEEVEEIKMIIGFDYCKP
ncbi:unnamed protein product [Arabidopsis thaliana]|uniref:(thale cress) hypothetical protein n=1 Tax=Arabidopsis thaliana TaxID=3702 RepID=A0A7G2EPT8_ARATH|nr:unnamed protein product [Arabidopsis thaliana]